SSHSTPFPYTTLFRSLRLPIGYRWSSAEDDHDAELTRSADYRQAAAHRTSRNRVQAAFGLAGRHRARKIRVPPLGSAPGPLRGRSEEHTSELQSPCNL